MTRSAQYGGCDGNTVFLGNERHAALSGTGDPLTGSQCLRRDHGRDDLRVLTVPQDGKSHSTTPEKLLGVQVIGHHEGGTARVNSHAGGVCNVLYTSRHRRVDSGGMLTAASLAHVERADE